MINISIEIEAFSKTEPRYNGSQIEAPLARPIPSLVFNDQRVAHATS
jgi:hypothetical protein